MISLSGKSPEQIRAALAKARRDELIDCITRLAAVEPLYKAAEIAALSKLNRRAVLDDISAGKFGDYFCRAGNSLAVPASGVHAWRERFRVRVKPKEDR